jgi:hypothetical protein
VTVLFEPRDEPLELLFRNKSSTAEFQGLQLPLLNELEHRGLAATQTRSNLVEIQESSSALHREASKDRAHVAPPF